MLNCKTGQWSGKIVLRILAVVTALLLMPQASHGESDRVPAWLFEPQKAVQLSPLKTRAGAFQGITSVGSGDDLALGFASFYLREAKAISMSGELGKVIRAFLEKGVQSPGRFPLSGTLAAFLLFSEANLSEPLIIVVSRTRPFFAVGKAHVVDEDVYQIDAKSHISASGESEYLWAFFEALARKHGYLAPAVSGK